MSEELRTLRSTVCRLENGLKVIEAAMRFLSDDLKLLRELEVTDEISEQVDSAQIALCNAGFVRQGLKDDIAAASAQLRAAEQSEAAARLMVSVRNAVESLEAALEAASKA